MSAYQPIQLGQLPTAMDGIGSALDQITQRRDNQRKEARELEQQKSDMLHRRRIEYSNALVQAHQHIKAGDLQSAQAVLAPYVNGFETADSPLGQPGAAPPPGPLPPVSGGSAVPDQVDQGRSLSAAGAAGPPAPVAPPVADRAYLDALAPATNDPDQRAAAPGAALAAKPSPTTPPPMPPQPGDQLGGAAPELADNEPMPAAAGPGPAPNPIMAARAQERATEQRRAQRLLRYADPFTGQQVTLDPAQAEQAQRDQMARQGGENERVLHQSFDELAKTDPFIAEQFPRILATYKAAGVPVDPKQILSDLMTAQREQNRDKRDQDASALREKLFAERLAADREKQQRDIDAGKYRRRGGGAGGAGGPGEKFLLQEAKAITPEMDKSLEDVTRKGGLRDTLLHADSALADLHNNVMNPVTWTNVIDSMIKTNTGGRAIKNQYDLYTQHAHGKVDDFDTWLASLRDGRPSQEQQKNILGAFEGSYNELRKTSKEAYDNYRRYDQDPRVARNHYVREHYNALERNAFGRMPGYAGQQGGGAAAPDPNGEIDALVKHAMGTK